MSRKIRLYSPLSPIPLAEKLKAEMDRKWTKAEKKTGRIMGRGTESKMSLRFQKWSVRNDFSTRLVATMEAGRGGTIITGRIGAARGVGCFMLFWFGFVGFFLFNGLILLGSDDAPSLFKAAFIGIPAVMLLGGLAMIKYGRRNGPEHEEKILTFLADKVKAREERGQ